MSIEPTYFHPIKFRLLRVQAGYGRAELAREAKISKDTIKIWERGRDHWTRPGIGSLQRVARVLGCTVDDFLEPVSWVPTHEELALLKAHFDSVKAGQHRIGGSTNPKPVRLAAAPSTYVERWLEHAQSYA